MQGVFRQVRCSAHRPLVVSPKEGFPIAIIAGVNLSSLRVLRRTDAKYLGNGRRNVDIFHLLDRLSLEIWSSGIKDRFHLRSRGSYS